MDEIRLKNLETVFKNALREVASEVMQAIRQNE